MARPVADLPLILVRDLGRLEISLMARVPADPYAPLGRNRLYLSLVLLTLVNALNIMDRFLPSALAEQIKRDLHLSDTAIGLLNGFGFVIVYAFMGIPVARIADRGLFGTVLSASLA